MSESLHGEEIKKKRILAYQNKAPAPPDSHLNPLRVVYSARTPMSTKSSTRFIPSNPERILDAPDFINDYCKYIEQYFNLKQLFMKFLFIIILDLNLMDWSNHNIVTVALGPSVYLWNAETGNIKVLFEMDEGDHACSLSWIQEGHILAVGTDSGTVELWDCEQMKR